MPTFVYKAKRGPQELVEGEVEASTRDEAVRLISDLGYFPVQVKEQGKASVFSTPEKAPEKGPGPFLQKGTRSLFRKIRGRDITLFTRQLAMLFRSHVPILTALVLLREQAGHLAMKRLIDSIYEDVRGGKTVSAALGCFPQYFPSVYVALIRSGELSGELQEILERIARFRENEEEFHRQVRGAMAYPLFLLAVGAVTVAILLAFVMPRLLKLFKDMETTLPLPTRILMGVSDLCAQGWPFLVGAVTVSLIVYRSSQNVRSRLKGFWDKAQLKLPVLAPLAKGAEMERFTRTLAVLLKSGVSIVQAVESTVGAIGSESIRKELHDLGKEMVGGTALSEALAKAPSFPPWVRRMIAVGEEGGRMDEILEEVANHYHSEVQAATKLMASLLEPILILVLGAVVGFIVAAMLLPVFQLNLGIE